MKTPLTLDKLQAVIIASKRQGWEEGREQAIALLSQDYQGANIADKMYITALGARLMAATNPYGAS